MRLAITLLLIFVFIFSVASVRAFETDGSLGQRVLAFLLYQPLVWWPNRPPNVQVPTLSYQNVDVLALSSHHINHRVAEAVAFLKGTGIPVASVAAGFPAGQTSMVQRLAEIRGAVAAGALEIDIVISREHVLQGNWTKLYEEVRPLATRALRIYRRTLRQ